MPNFKTIPIGTVLTRLTVIGNANPKIGPDGRHAGCSKCQCICGNIVVVRNSQLKNGHTKSCGCLSIELTKQRKLRHGFAARTQRHPLYASWVRMHQRCNNPNDKNYRLYGGRGITVCERWKSFAAFLEDMGNKPLGHSLDRIDCNGNYEPSNCRWADPKTQARNNRFHTRYVFDGIESNLSEHCERLNLNYVVIRSRISYGWSIERALSQPIRKRG